MKRPFLADLERLPLSNFFKRQNSFKKIIFKLTWFENLTPFQAQELELPMLDINSVEIPRLNSEIQFGIYNFRIKIYDFGLEFFDQNAAFPFCTA